MSTKREELKLLVTQILKDAKSSFVIQQEEKSTPRTRRRKKPKNQLVIRKCPICKITIESQSNFRIHLKKCAPAVYDEIMYQNPAYFTAQEPESINQTIINGNHSVDVQKILEQYYKKSPFKKKEQSNTPVAQPQQQQQTKQFTPRKPQQPVPIQPSVAPLRPLISSFDPRRIPLFKTMPTFANLNALFINNVIREMHTAEPKLEPIKEEHITVDDYEQWTAEEALNRYIQNCESMKEIFSPIFEQEDEEKLFEERMRRLNAISEKIEELASEPVCKKIKLENDEMSTNGNVLAEKTFEKLLKESSSSMKEIVKKGFKRPTENVEFYKL